MSGFWLSRDEVRELDRRAIEGFGVPGVVLMENAGRGCAELLMRLNPEKKPLVVLCGPGNNGGDGFVIARHLDNHGWPMKVIAVECPSPTKSNMLTMGFDFGGLHADALTHYRILSATGRYIFPLARRPLFPSVHNELARELQLNDAWIVDALFGTGLNRGLGPPFDEVIAMMNASQNPVLAVDIPSGLDCDTGEPLGPTVKATHTATFVAHKKGFLNPASRPWTGEVHVIDIGAPRVLIDEYRKRRESPPPPVTPEP